MEIAAPCGLLAAGYLYREAIFFEQGFDDLPVVALNFDAPIFHRAPHAAALFEGLCARFEGAAIVRQTGDDRNRFAPASFGFSQQAYYSIPGLGRFEQSAATVCLYGSAVRTEASSLGTVNRAGLLGFAALHGDCSDTKCRCRVHRFGGRRQAVGDKTTNELVDELQAEIAFQGQSLIELNDMVALQQRDLLLLKRQLALLGETLNALRGERAHGALAGESSEKPPHY
ncbi:MAG: putative coiled-coil protein SlyX [Halieaceae bacterium]